MAASIALAAFVAADGAVYPAAIAREYAGARPAVRLADVVVFDGSGEYGVRLVRGVPYAPALPGQALERTSWHWPEPEL